MDATMPGWVLDAAVILWIVAIAAALTWGFRGDATDWPDETETEEFE